MTNIIQIADRRGQREARDIADADRAVVSAFSARRIADSLLDASGAADLITALHPDVRPRNPDPLSADLERLGAFDDAKKLWTRHVNKSQADLKARGFPASAIREIICVHTKRVRAILKARKAARDQSWGLPDGF